ncbi:MAG: methylated-DNA--[protein]-cysteine S-methyltransferase [Candidatus Bipolaricaulota bacterium]|nr:methylated-DNA--[protein]-cysteine S-methyltransferase [Candidatus Bipolaricaulota bacterium]MDW8126977.1 methylated-DNA--[protein]-cysteine S-methyltransferase [Candidatus Bipolaricaulota bacterium]
MPWGKVPTVWGTFYARWEGPSIVELRFPDPPFQGQLIQSPLLWRLSVELDEYFSGARAFFTVPIKLEGPQFFHKVWKELSRIPYGETLTYGELARRVGNPKAFRAVGQAMAHNPVPIIVPCHRVVGKRSLGGFGPGLAWKEKLLALEEAHKEKFSPR